MAGALAVVLALLIMQWAPWRAVAPREPLRLRADLGADASLANSIANEYGDAAVLSPDGAVVAFVAQKGETGRTQLFVRRLNQLHATPLSGTEDALSPFFSPDGQWIGFSAERKLKKIAVNGGASATLCDVTQLRGGSWGEDGTIVFSLSDQRSMHLMRVSSEGGTPEPLTASGDGEVAQLWPQILPGGKAVLYTSSDVVGAYNGANLVVQPLPDGPRKIVQRGGFHGRYVPSGHLVYIHDGTLFAAPFDLDRLELTGPPALALEGVASNSITGGAQFSVSASGAARVSAGSDERRRHPDRLDESGRTNVAPAGDPRQLAQSTVFARWPPACPGDSGRPVGHLDLRVGARRAQPFHVRSGGRRQTRMDA